MRALIASLLLGLVLSGCFTVAGRGDGVAKYDFGPSPASLSASLRPVPLALEVRAPLWLDTPGVGYRLAYLEAARLHEYSRARWVGAPAQLIQQRLIHQLGLMQPGQAGAACVLRLDLAEFSQNFSDPEHSQGVLRGRVGLLGRSRQVLAELSVDIARPADTQDARGGIAALSAAVGQLALDLRDWEARLSAGSSASACFR